MAGSQPRCHGSPIHRVHGDHDLREHGDARNNRGRCAQTTTNNAVGNATINAVTGGLPGQHMWIIIANDLVSAKTITFGANLRSSGALAGTPGRSATIQFISDGSAWYEAARTTNL